MVNNKRDRLKKYSGQLAEKGVETIFHVDQSVYYDGRQYGCKLSKQIMKFVDYKKGDKLRFTIDISGKGNPRITAEYIQDGLSGN